MRRDVVYSGLRMSNSSAWASANRLEKARFCPFKACRRSSWVDMAAYRWESLGYPVACAISSGGSPVVRR